MANYNSAFTGTHNDEYDERIITLNNTKVNRSGDTITGQLIIEGIAGDNPLIVRGITGRANNANNDPGDLYLNPNRDGFVDILNNILRITSNGSVTVTGLISIGNNGNTMTIGSQNAGFGHFMNSANIPFYFNRPIQVDGDIIIYNNGEHGLTRGGISSSWYNGRDKALVKITTANGYSCGISIKTTNGTWQIGHYNATNYHNQLLFDYVTDANYSSANNTSVKAKITAAGAFTNASQRKYKENIKAIDYSCLDIINSIKICSFNMIGDPEKDYRVGFIADDTNPIVSGKNQDVMDLQNCIGVLIKAVQELSQKCDLLENKIKELS